MSTTRDRMIEAAAESLRRRGVAGTSFTDVLTASRAARGAIYHHFPGGKDELAQAAVRWTGATVGRRFRSMCAEETSPAAVVRAFVAAVRPAVAESAAGAGCAVAAATAEGPPGSGLQAAAREALDSWRAVLTDHLVAAGMTGGAASARAALLIAMLEGAHVLCRAEGSVAPFDSAAEAIMELIAARPGGSVDRSSTGC